MTVTVQLHGGAVYWKSKERRGRESSREVCTSDQGLAPQIEKAVNEIRAQADEAPPAHAEISRDFLAHEEALLAFVRLELEGKDGSPAVESLLRAWSAE